MQTWILKLQRCFEKSLVNIDCMDLKKKINFQCFIYIYITYSWQGMIWGSSFIINKTNLIHVSHYSRMLSAMLGCNKQSVFERKLKKKFKYVSNPFFILSPLELASAWTLN